MWRLGGSTSTGSVRQLVEEGRRAIADRRANEELPSEQTLGLLRGQPREGALRIDLAAMTAQGGDFLTGMARRVDDERRLGGERAEGVHIDRPQRDVVGGAGIRLRRLDDPIRIRPSGNTV